MKANVEGRKDKLTLFEQRAHSSPNGREFFASTSKCERASNNDNGLPLTTVAVTCVILRREVESHAHGAPTDSTDLCPSDDLFFLALVRFQTPSHGFDPLDPRVSSGLRVSFLKRPSSHLVSFDFLRILLWVSIGQYLYQRTLNLPTIAIFLLGISSIT